VKNRSILTCAAFVCAAALSSCGTETTSAGPPDDLAFAEQVEAGSPTTLQLIEGIPDVELTDGEANLVSFEANWVCELQRRTFPSQEAIEDDLNEKLAGLGVDRSEYDAFRAEVNQSQDLRDSILYAYQENCRA
jgi:hypothetical protein